MQALIPWWVRCVALAAVCAVLWGHGYFTGADSQKSSTASVQAQFDAVKAQTEAAGRQAEAVAKSKESAARQLKEQADAENTRTLADLRTRLELLRHANSGASIVPAAPPGASRPDLACYDRAELQRALGDFLEDARRIVDEGSSAAIDLNTAKEWVLRLKMSAPP